MKRLILGALILAGVLAVAWATVRHASPQLSDTAAACHSAAHLKGERAYVAHESDPLAGLARGASRDAAACGWGYYHAYFEEVFEDRPEPALAATLCAQAAEGREDGPAISRVCFGSAGSGFLRARLPEGWGPALQSAREHIAGPLEACRAIGAPEYGLRACRAGVFGELIYRSVQAATSAPARRDLLALCGPYAGDERMECMRKVGASLFMSGDYSFPALAQFAALVTDPHEREAVFKEGAEVFFLDPSLRMSPEGYLTQCARVVETEEWCAEAGARGAFDASVSLDPERDALRFCGLDAVKERGLDVACYAELAALSATVYDVRRTQTLCAGFPRELRYSCAVK